MTTPLRALGQSSLMLSPVGIGTWAFGGTGWAGSWGSQDDVRSIEALDAAIEGGCNWVDTAPVYGLGHAEEVIGEFLRKVPASSRPLVMTKCGFQWNADEPDHIWQALTPQRIRQEFEDSARRLRVPHIDLFQIHWPDLTTEESDSVPLEESWGAMATLVDEGNARAIGVSNFSVDELERCERVRHVDSVQPPFSLIGRTAASDVIPWAAAHGTGVLAYSPLQSGLLTERASIEWAAGFADDDWRRTAPEFTAPRLERNILLRDKLMPIAERRGCSVAAIALAWALGVPGVTGAIVGGRSRSQVEGWVGAGAVTLSAEDQSEINDALRRTGAGDDWSVYPNPVG